MMAQGRIDLQLAAIVNDHANNNREKESDTIPILVKVAYLISMVTLAMILIFNGSLVGYAIYAKEVVEFVMFILFLKKRRRK